MLVFMFLVLYAHPCVLGTASESAPRVHPDVGAISYPTEQLYTRTGEWTLSINLPIQCPDKILDTHQITSLQTTVTALVNLYKNYEKLCTNEGALGGSSVDYLCHILANDKGDMEDTIDWLNKGLSNYRNLLIDQQHFLKLLGCKIPTPIRLLDFNVSSASQETFDFLRQASDSSGDDDLTTEIVEEVTLSGHASRGDFSRRQKRSFEDDMVVRNHVTDTVKNSSRPISRDINPLQKQPGSVYVGDHGVYITDVHIGHNSTFHPSGVNHGIEQEVNQHSRSTSGESFRPSDLPHETSKQTIPGTMQLLDRQHKVPHNSYYPEYYIRHVISDAKSLCMRDPFDSQLSTMMKHYFDLIGRLSPNNQVDYCSLLPQAFKCLHQKSTLNRNRRSVLAAEKGWIPWDWSVNHWMWGSMGAEEAESINKAFSEQSDINKDLRNLTLTLANKSMSAIRILADEHKSLVTQLQTALKTITGQTTTWASGIQENIKSLAQEGKSSKSLMLGTLILLQASQVKNEINILTQKLLEYCRYTKDILQIVQVRVFPFRFLTDKVLNDALGTISIPAAQRKKIIHHSNAQLLFSNIPMSCCINKQSVQLLFSIPLISTQFNMVTWRIVTIPLYVGTLWMELSQTHEALNVDADKKVWQGFTNAEFAMCRDNPLNLCPFTPPIHVMEDTNCLIDILNAQPDYKTTCTLSVVAKYQESLYHVLPLTGSSWLVSTKASSLTTIKRCLNSATGEYIDQQHALSGLAEIRLLPTCVLNLGSVSLIPYDTKVSGYRVKPSYDFTYPSKTNMPTIQNLTNIWSRLKVNSSLVPSLEMVNTTLQISNGQANLETLINYFKNPNNTDLSSLTRFARLTKDKNEKDDGHQVSIPWSSISISMPWSIKVAEVIHYLCDFIVFCILIEKFCRMFRSHIPRVGYPMSLMRDTYAAPLKPFHWLQIDEMTSALVEKPTTTSTTEQTTQTSLMTNITEKGFEKAVSEAMRVIYDRVMWIGQRVNNTRTIDHPVTSRIGITSQEQLLSMVYTGLLMIVLALVCHHYFRMTIKNSLRRSLRVMGFAPLNRCYLHHAGETRLIINLGVIAYRSMHATLDYEHLESSCRSIVSVQLCTLPGSPDTYVATHAPSLVGMITDTHNRRVDMKFTAKFQWGKICIRSKANLQNSICASLPQEISLPLDEIILQMKDHLPYFWTHLDVETVHSLYLTGMQGANLLYEAGKESAGNSMWRDLDLGPIPEY
ncbi:glycoprotein [Taiyuan leafhopper virus]|uniref:Glycoprotein n=1 Tax=Taiyuan leafhopper virus TaxID=2482723 RepID=A0A455LK50_9VIRU|nr:glycoprotein [Taiyuan leafhopper virus]AYN64864.1 glycoprotein [Taiyuan leafhopper virus]